MIVYKKWLVISDRLGVEGGLEGWKTYIAQNLQEVLKMVKAEDEKAYWKIEYIFSIEKDGEPQLRQYGVDVNISI